MVGGDHVRMLEGPVSHLGYVINAPTLWAAAAEFTREWLEQIRQLEADIEWAKGMSNTPEEVLFMGKLNTSELAVVWTRDLHASCRILARLETALADLKRGMANPTCPSLTDPAATP